MDTKTSMKLLLAEVLMSTETVHKQWEQDNLREGHSDPDWPTWYAAFMVDETHLVVMSHTMGKQVQEILRRYQNDLKSLAESMETYELLENDDVSAARASNQKDIDYTQELIDLFE